MNDNRESGRRRNEDPYSFKRTGNYGIFKSNGSFPIEYLQTTFSIDELVDLTLAREVSPENLDFELLMQRDIDEGRVENKMVPYLSPESSHDALARTTFFPPILVAALPVDHDVIQKYYPDEIATINNQEQLVREWPGYFKVDYFKNGSQGGKQITHIDSLTEQKATVDLHEVQMSFKLSRNNKGTKLVVIDGQHRLHALREVHKKKAESVSDLIVPVCIIFPPKATEGLASAQLPDVIQVFRHLFVDVNTTMELVGGHFNILLSDSTIGSIFCRELCNYALAEENGDKILSTIEWNTKSKKDSTIVKKAYSITSIGVLEKSLLKSLGKKTYKSTLKYLIQHPEVEAELARLSSEGSSDIEWDKFEHAQSKCLKGQVSKYLTPCIYNIFFKSKTYNSLLLKIMEQLDQIKSRSEEDTAIALDAKNVYRHLTQYVPLNGDDSRKILKLSEQEIADFKSSENIEFLTYAIFQRAVIASWVEFIDQLRSTALPPTTLTKVFIDILDYACRDNLKLLRKDALYIRYAIWGTLKVKAKDDTVNALRSLILSSLGDASFVDKLIEKYELSEKLSEEGICLSDIAYDRAAKYIEHYEKERKKDFIISYSVSFETLDRDEIEELTRAENELKRQNIAVRKGELSKESVIDNFTPLVARHVKEDVQLAHKAFKDAFGFENDIYVYDIGDKLGENEEDDVS